jgi:multiple antibiotic resistance protein
MTARPQILSLFVSTFTTLLAIINPLEALPIFLGLLKGKDKQEHLRVAKLSCTYAALLMFFFLVFGTVVLKLFGVPLSMVRMVGGIILMRIGFSLFMPKPSDGGSPFVGQTDQAANIAFVPLAMPLMFGPGALATVIGMSSMVAHPESNLLALGAIAAAILLTMTVTYFVLAYADLLLGRLGPNGIDAITRLVGFFVSAMGMGLVFHGLIDTLRSYGLAAIR